MSTTTAATAATAMPITGIDIHTYFIKEPQRAIAFWRDTIGLTPTWVDEGHGAEFELPDGSSFGLWKLDDMPWQKGSGINFGVPDIHTAVAYFRARGVQIVHVEETPICWMAFAHDSEGNDFAFHQRKAP
jgi:predicted enzyme related to lactoylglutathione lyase